MGGTSKGVLEALWRRSRAIRKKALGRKLSKQELQSLPPQLQYPGELSPQDFQSLPPQLRWPDKLHGFPRPKGLRGPALVQWVMFLAGYCGDKRFDDFINALLEHKIIEAGTHGFIPGPGPEIDRANEYQQARCLEEVHAQIKQGMDVRPACRKVAAEIGRAHV